MLEVILLCAIAGIGGTSLGGLVSIALMRYSSDKTTCWMLSFAAGIMVSIVSFGLLPEAIDLGGIVVSVASLIGGVVVVMFLNGVVDGISARRQEGHEDDASDDPASAPAASPDAGHSAATASHASPAAGHSAQEHSPFHHSPVELFHEGSMIENRAMMVRSSIIMFVALGLHNIPEGLAVGAGGSHDIRLGILLVTMVALHNIPEGMAIATPMLAGGIGRWKAFGLTALSGATELFGGIVGVFFGSLSDFTVAISLALASGAMLYVVFSEVLPLAVILLRSRSATIITVAGVIIGLLLSQL